MPPPPPRIRVISKKVSSFLIFLVVNLIFLELFSFFILLCLGKAHWNYELGNTHWHYEKTLKNIPKNMFEMGSEPEYLNSIYSHLLSGSVAHPYFAFRYKGSSYGKKRGYGMNVDVHGFFGDVQFPFEKKPTDFIFGILGGSVSKYFAEYIFRNKEAKEKLINVLRERYSSTAGKNIKLVSLGQGGNKQPQQFFIASYLLKYLDVTINIEGYNEYNEPVPSEYPIEFPSSWHFSYLKGVDRENHNLYQKVRNILFFRQVLDMSRFDRVAPFLRFSSSYFPFSKISSCFFR